MHQFHKFIFVMKRCMFQTVPLSIIRSFSLYTQQWYMSYRFVDSLQAGSGVLSWSCSQAVSKPVRHIPLLYVQWKTPDDGQRNCPKFTEFYSKDKFEKLVHLVHFIIRKSSNRRTALDKCWNSNQVLTSLGPKFTHSFVREWKLTMNLKI
jgi:hypothetical protein